MGNGGKIQINLLFYKLKFWSDPYVFGFKRSLDSD